MDKIFERTIQLIGNEKFELLQTKRIAIFGIGGVGGTTFEVLVRSGVSSITIVDFDNVNESNLNRQVLFNLNDISKKKVDCAYRYAKSINPDVQLNVCPEKVDKNFFLKNDLSGFDYFIDAIDDCVGKLEIAKYALSNNISLIMCLGMGNRLDPSQVFLSRLDKTENDPLARKIRNLFRKEGLDLKHINVVVSKETPIKKEGNPSSMMMVPSSAGLLIAYKVLKDIVQ